METDVEAKDERNGERSGKGRRLLSRALARLGREQSPSRGRPSPPHV